MLKILFLRPGRLGDMVVATPVFKALKKKFPDIFISVVASPYNEIIIRYNSYIDKIKKVNYHSVIEVIKMIFWIRKQRFEWVIDLTPGISRTSTLISRLVRSDHIRTAGMHKGKDSKYFDKVTDFQNLHIIERNMLLLENILNCSFNSESTPDIFYLPKHENDANFLFKRLNDKNILIGINCSAGKPCRQWSSENYRNLLNLLIAKYPEAGIILFSVGKQSAWAKQFEKEMKNTIAVADQEILTVAAIINKMSLFFTPDTSLLHIASGFKIPIVGLYFVEGENFIRWRARGIMSRELIARKTEDVNEISPDAAIQAIDELIDLKRKV